MKKSLLLLALLICFLPFFSQEWQHIGLAGEKIQAIAVNPVNADMIFVNGSRTINGGASWTSTTVLFMCDYAFHPYSDTIYGAFGEGSYSDGIYYSIDSGNTWQILHWLYMVSAFTIPVHDPDFIIAGTAEDGVYISTNYGSDFSYFNDSLDNLSIRTLIHFYPVIENKSWHIYLAGTEAGIFHCHGPADYWHSTNISTGDTVVALASDVTGWNVYGAVRSDEETTGIYQSPDAGYNWNLIKNYAHITDVLVNPLNFNTIYASSSDFGIIRSTDAGVHWESLNFPTTDSTVFCIAQTQADTTRLFAGTNNGVYAIDLPVGIYETNSSKLLNIYPNPANNTINIETRPKTDIQLINLQGKRILKREAKSNLLQINLSGYCPGIYFIRAQSGDRVFYSKFVKH